MKAWLDLWRNRRLAEENLRQILSSAHVVKLESRKPAECLIQFLQAEGLAKLSRKVAVVPFAVRRNFTEVSVSLERAELIVAAGRLGTQQKNPLLLAEILQAYCAKAPRATVEIHVRGAAEELDELSRVNRRISLFHDSPPAMVADALSRAQVFVSASRWESTPIIGLEALCMGCTLVAPSDLRGYQSLIDEGQFGTPYQRGSVKSAVCAIQSEVEMWSVGRRDPRFIAKYWRSRNALQSVAEDWIRLISGHAQHRTAASRHPEP